MTFWKTEQYPLNSIAQSMRGTGEPIWSYLQFLEGEASGDWLRSLQLAQDSKRRSILPRIVDESLQSLHWANRAQNSRKYAEIGAFTDWLSRLSYVFTIQLAKYQILTDRLDLLDRRYPTSGRLNDRLMSLSRQILTQYTYAPSNVIDPCAAIVSSVVLKIFALPGANWGRAFAARSFKQGLDVSPSFRPSPGYPIPGIPDVNIPPRPDKLPSGRPAAPIGAWRLIIFVGAIVLAAYLIVSLLLEKPVLFQRAYVFGENPNVRPAMFFAIVGGEYDIRGYLIQAAKELIDVSGREYNSLTGFATNKDKEIQEAYNLLNLEAIEPSTAQGLFDRLIEFYPEDGPPF